MRSDADAVVREVRSLAEEPWFRGIYRRIYEVIAAEGRLPPPDGIYVAVRLDGELPSNVMGFAIPEAGIVWFRERPPSPSTFAHELIHLAVKRSSLDEEVYAYNLAGLVVLMAERGIVPVRNPLRLFEDVGPKDILAAVNEVYGGGFKNLEDFFLFVGVMPPFVLQPTDVRTEAVEAVSELVAGAVIGDEAMLRVVLTLLER